MEVQINNSKYVSIRRCDF